MTVPDLMNWIEENKPVGMTARQVLEAGLAKLNTTHSDWCSTKAAP